MGKKKRGDRSALEASTSTPTAKKANMAADKSDE